MNILNSRFYIFLEKVSNLFILNVIWLIACLPIITIFPATAAMFSVIRQWKLHDETSVFMPFTKHFKLNFKQSLLIGLLWIPFAFLLYIDYFYVIQALEKWRTFLLVPLFFIAMIFMFMSTFLFPVMIHYQLRLRDVLKNSFIVSLAYFPTTLLIIIFGGICLLIIIYVPVTFLIIFSIWANINFLLCNRSFNKIEKLKTVPALEE
ncbi:YesL family protein [Bacillus sp. FSL K6-3431]|uniref:YesL family protein n=1 Tax=Bacillus sp. FSL K6-3431 TaxID=2921500 RepID=UPI0030F9AF55